MHDSHFSIAKRMLKCAETKDLAGAISLFTEDAVFLDPHYPKVRMQGRDEITEGMRWGFNSLKKFGFDIINTYSSVDGEALIISVVTSHELHNGKQLSLPQLFAFEFEGERVRSLQAYLQYEPHGIAGLMLKFARLRYFFFSLIKRIAG